MFIRKFIAGLAECTGFAKVNLAFHADAGTLTNVTNSGVSGSYAVNSYTGEAQAADANYSLADQLKDYYNTELLENSRIDMIYAQFAKRQALPAGHNGTVEWRKWNTFARAGKLQEGVIPTGQKFGATKINGSVDQYGTYVTISDVLELNSYDDIIDGATVEMGASAAETGEALIRDNLYTGTNVVYCDKITRATGAETPVTEESELVEDATYHCHLTPKMVNKVATKMKKDKVPTIGGKYVAVIHPSVAFDLRQSDEWLEVHKYDSVQEIFRGEIGELHGVRFIENTFAPIIKQTTEEVTGVKVGLYAGASTQFEWILDPSIWQPTVSSTVYYKTAASVAGLPSPVVGDTVDTSSSTNKYYAMPVATVPTDHAVYVGKKVMFLLADSNDKVVSWRMFDIDSGKEIDASGNEIEPIAMYATYFFGREAFGIIDPEGGALQMIVKSKKEIGGPLEQFSTIGYKFETNGATILYNERMVRCMSTSEYSSVDEAN